MKETLFTKIANGTIKSYIWHQNEKYMAFLTPFPNTKGVTVVAPKMYMPSYVFSLDENVYIDFLRYVKIVANILDMKLGVARTSLIFEGTGIDHLHAKLYPLHGPKASQTDVWADHVVYFNEYPGYVSTVEGPKANDFELESLCTLLRVCPPHDMA